jgi:hypothetical protein
MGKFDPLIDKHEIEIRCKCGITISKDDLHKVVGKFEKHLLDLHFASNGPCCQFCQMSLDEMEAQGEDILIHIANHKNQKEVVKLVTR